MIRTTIFTKLSREVRPDDDLNAENLRDVDGGVVEMELLNGDKRTTEVNSLDSFVERLKGTTFTQVTFVLGTLRADALTLKSHSHSCKI